jgi:Skp family chaperone for outer membrane proteins
MRLSSMKVRVGGLPLIAILAVLASAGSEPAAAADKAFGVVDSQRIVEEYPAARDAQEQWQKYVRDLEREVAEKERALQRLIEEIESQRMLLGEEALAAKLQDLEKQKADYFRFREQADQRVQQEYQDKIGPIINQVKTVAERIGKESDFGIIIDSAAFTVLYLDPAVDLTNQVLAALARGDRD